jgi:Flp pilus assembly protein CpaB
MRGFHLALVIAAVLAAVAATVVTASARAEAACSSGYVLTSGGIAEADANRDGLTCERTIVGSEDDTLIALDNAAVTPTAAPEPCPDNFFINPSTFFEDADRNDNGLVCRKVFKAGQPSDPHLVQVVIDDHL